MMYKGCFLTFFIVLFASGLNAQNDFRRMNWYESSETLIEKYSDEDFSRETDMGMTTYFYEGYVASIETRIIFYFINNQLIAGVYHFTPERSRYLAKDFIRDWDNVSINLRSKYPMKRSDIWYTENADVSLMGIDYYLSDGDVHLMESAWNGDTQVYHSLSNSEGYMHHVLMYLTPDFIKKVKGSLEDDF